MNLEHQIDYVTVSPVDEDFPELIQSSSLEHDDILFANLVEPTPIRHDDAFDDIEPTPINPERLISVERVPLHATSWNMDKLCYESLKELSFNQNNLKTSDTIVMMPSSRQMVRNNSAISFVSMSSAEENSLSQGFHKSQVDLWNLRYEELVAFQKEHKHCLVPLKNYENPSLSHWVKRQRYQYRVKQEGQHSTLNDERQAALEKLGFVWDSHAASWEERWNDLCIFHEIHGHSNVPKTYKTNPQLAIWVKGQRRQFKLYTQGKSSAMSTDRIEKLLHLGFVFDPRSRR